MPEMLDQWQRLRELEKLEPKKPPYRRYAFHNVYNYTLLAGVAAASLLAWTGLPIIVGLGLEALWMVYGPDSKLLRRFFWDKKHAKKLAAEEQERQVALLATLQASDQQRFAQLQMQQQEILRLCNQNPSFTAELLRGELCKLDRLVGSFLELALSCNRYEEYLGGVDLNQLERDERRYRKEVESGDETRRPLAQKNLGVLVQRREKLRELLAFVRNARGQLDLIENTFRLLADQIVGMQSPKELSGQLDDLIDGVEAVRSTAREADALLAEAR